MHAYILVGQEINNLQFTINNLAQKLHAKIMEFPLKKIDDVRELNSFTSLEVGEPTAILINSIEEATNEALNAFLKNLEEPQENLYYILTTSNLSAILPTIVSRCQIIKSQITSNKSQNLELEKFFNKSVGEKLAFVDKIKDRGEAENFVRELISEEHGLLHKTKDNYSEIARNLQNLTQTLGTLKANGNVNLQLTRMVINLNF